MNPLIERHRDAIRALAREYGVARLEVFGSACSPEFDPERSDVDFLVDYPPGYDMGPWLSRYQELREALARLLGRDIDLVETSALRYKPRFGREADETRSTVYEAAEVAEVT